ncbi:MAG: hypothetical protein ACK4YO_03320, partial [Candidatus Altarchaeaceae archaeon]
MENIKFYNGVSYAILVGILIFGILISGCIEKEKKVSENSVVEINFTDDKNITSKKYIFIGKKEYSFEDKLIGAKVNDVINLECEDVVSVQLQHNPEIGKIYATQMGQIKIFRIDNENIYFGHPLAGETLNFNVKIKKIENIRSVAIECLKKYNITPDTVAFYHASWCPHCRKMEPYVKDLESKGYKFLWAGTDVKEEAENLKIAKECYKNVLKFNQGVPQFGCVANGKLHIGEFLSIDEMKAFAE